MDMSKFEYDFKQNLINVINSASLQFEEEIQSVLSQNLNLNDKEAILRLLDLRFIQSVNVCASLMNDYHKSLIAYLEKSSEVNS